MSRNLEIREVGVRLFYDRGYNSTSLKDIASEMNLRAPSLYNHIESKQKLLQEIMFDGIDSLADEFEAAIEGLDNVIDMIRRGAEAHILHHARSRIQAHVNTYEIPSLQEPARTELLRRRRKYAHRWESLIQRGMEEGSCRTSNHKLAAFSIIDLGAGVARWYRPDGSLTEAELVAFYGELSLSIVGATQAARRAANQRAATTSRSTEGPD